MATLYGVVQRKLHASLQSGHAPCPTQGLSSKRAAHIRTDLDMKRKAAAACAKLNVATLQAKIFAKQKQIDSRQGIEAQLSKSIARLLTKQAKLVATKAEQTARLVTKKKPADRDKTAQRIAKCGADLVTVRAALKNTVAERKTVRGHLHQHRRRLGILHDKLAAAQARTVSPSFAFGSKCLFAMQFELGKNGYADHAAWLKDWRAARSSSVYIEGVSRYGGNEFVKPTITADGSISLEVRLPDALKAHADTSGLVRRYTIHSFALSGLRFNHGHEAVLAALRAHTEGRGKPITWRFTRDGDQWYAHVTIHQELLSATKDFSRGCLGVDLNQHHVSVTQVSTDGNPLKVWRFPLSTYGKTTEQAKDLIRKTTAAIVTLAISLGRLPIISEDLDFADKKAQLEVSHGSRQARQLSSFAYSSFDAALHSACRRSTVWHGRVNPSFTSMIGRLKFARLYGLSVHASAALCIARRAMRQSERLPSPVVVHPDNGDAASVTLDPPVRMGRRHVWSAWRRLSPRLKATLTAYARARRAGLARRTAGAESSADLDGRQPIVRGTGGILPDAASGLEQRAA